MLGLRALVESDSDVEHVQHLHATYQSPHVVLLTIEPRFKGTLTALDIRMEPPAGRCDVPLDVSGGMV